MPHSSKVFLHFRRFASCATLLKPSSLRPLAHVPPSILGKYSHETFQRLSNEMKTHEAAFEPLLKPGLPFVMRLDGVAFRKLTRHMHKPFDARFTAAMLATAEYLVEKTGARIGFCQSDEITLVCCTEVVNDAESSIPPNSTVMYGGRVQKIASIVAGMAAAKFSSCIRGCDWSDVQEARDAQQQQKNHRAVLRRSNETFQASQQQQPSDDAFPPIETFFDCRVFNVPDARSAAHAVYWRHNFDCRRNAINAIGFAHFAHADLHAHSLTRVVERLFVERGVDAMKDFDAVNIFGAFVKRKRVHFAATNRETGVTTEIVRSRIQTYALNMDCGNDDEMTQLVVAKHWNDVPSVYFAQKSSAMCL